VVQFGGARRVGGAAHQKTTVSAQANARLAGHHGGVNQRINAGVDVEYRTAGELISAKDVNRVGLWRSRGLACIAVVSDGRGILVVCGAAVVDIVRGAGFGTVNDSVPRSTTDWSLTSDIWTRRPWFHNQCRCLRGSIGSFQCRELTPRWWLEASNPPKDHPGKDRFGHWSGSCFRKSSR